MEDQTAQRAAPLSASSARLGKLGLDEPTLSEAVQDGERERRRWGVNAPAAARGVAGWGRTVETLRRILGEQAGWRIWPGLKRQLEGVVDPAGKVAVVPATGNEGTGMAGCSPSNKYKKGIWTHLVANWNRSHQGLLFPVARDGEDPVEQPEEIWILLIRPEADEIRFELSLPDRVVDGFICSWKERILLPPLLLGTVAAPEDPPVPTDDINVEVVRRAKSGD